MSLSVADYHESEIKTKLKPSDKRNSFYVLLTGKIKLSSYSDVIYTVVL